MREVLDPDAVRRWARVALEDLGSAREQLDALNVYPVPDGDTGTNLYLTTQAACAELDRLSPDADVTATLDAAARGALTGARGSSGIIVSQFLQRMARTLAEQVEATVSGVDGPLLARALADAADAAHAAVADPQEGTMLTVARAAADGAAAAGGRLSEVVRAAADASAAAVSRTPEQLEILRRAGVVDAGGRGLAVVLDALVTVVTGAAPSRPPVAAGCGRWTSEAGPPATSGYEVMYLLDAPDSGACALRERLAGLGESVVIVGRDGHWHVHVHSPDVGAIVEAGIAVGRPHQIRVTPLPTAAVSAPPGGRKVVAVAAGDGLAAVFYKAGAAVVRSGPKGHVSSATLLSAVLGAGTPEVVLLPNDAVTHVDAERTAARAREAGLRVAVLPTVATVQGLAALAVHDPTRTFEDDVVHMTAVAGHARHGAVTVAERPVRTASGPCRPGEVLGVIEGVFVLRGVDVAAVAAGVVDELLAGGAELLTLVTGQGAADDLAPTVTRHVRRSRPKVEIVVYDGGQARYPLLVGVE